MIKDILIMPSFKFIILILSLTILPIKSISQNIYFPIDTASILEKVNLLKASLKSENFNSNNLYALAKYYSEIGIIDSSNYYLEQALQDDIEIIEAIIIREFSELRKSQNWAKNKSKIITIWEELYPDGNIQFALSIIKMVESDQIQRALMEYELMEYGPNSKETIFREKETTRIDSLNIMSLDSLIQKLGWPSESLVGRDQLSSAAILLLHSDYHFKKKYLPYIKESVRLGELPHRMLAFFVDKLRVDENEPQLYGTQLIYNEDTRELELYRVENIRQLDERRLSVGLDSAHVYLKFMKSIY